MQPISGLLFLEDEQRLKFSLIAQSILVSKNERVWKDFLTKINFSSLRLFLQHQTDEKQLIIFKEVIENLIQHYKSAVEHNKCRDKAPVLHYIELLKEQLWIVVNKLAPCSQQEEYRRVLVVNALPRRIRKELTEKTSHKIYSARSDADQNFLSEVFNQLRIMETEEKRGTNRFSPNDINKAISDIQKQHDRISENLKVMFSELSNKLDEMMQRNNVLQLVRSN